MIQTIPKGILREGFELGLAQGVAQGEAHGKVRTIMAILKKKFKRIPKHVRETLNRMTDSIALESLAVHAALCDRLDEFENALK